MRGGRNMLSKIVGAVTFGKVCGSFEVDETFVRKNAKLTGEEVRFGRTDGWTGWRAFHAMAPSKETNPPFLLVLSR